MSKGDESDRPFIQLTAALQKWAPTFFFSWYKHIDWFLPQEGWHGRGALGKRNYLWHGGQEAERGIYTRPGHVLSDSHFPTEL